MKKNQFYRRQLGTYIFYFIWMCFLVIFSLISLVLTITFILEAYFHFNILFSGDPLFRGELIEIILANLLIFGFFGFFAGAFGISWVRIGMRRKKLYHKFRQLSDEEQMEVNTEIGLKTESIRPSLNMLFLFGRTRLYFRAHMFLHFVNYRDIAWVYTYNSAIPIVGVIGGDIMMSDNGMNVGGLMIWECDGTNYKIPTGADAFQAQEAIERIRENAPSAIVGFSRKRYKLAKKDLERFMLEGKAIL